MIEKVLANRNHHIIPTEEGRDYNYYSWHSSSR